MISEPEWSGCVYDDDTLNDSRPLGPQPTRWPDVPAVPNLSESSDAAFSTLDWLSIGASVVAVLSLIASIFSAIGAARSADVARSAEQRIAAGERAASMRELMRTAAKVELEARLAIVELEQASRTALANAACYSTPEKKTTYLKSNSEFQKKIADIQNSSSHGISVQAAMKKSDEWIANAQLLLDKTLAELAGEKAWACRRADQLTYVNRQIAEEITASERARNIYVQQDQNGLLI